MPQQIPAPDGARDPEKGKTSKTESFGYYHSSPAKCHRTNQRFHPQTTSGDKHPEDPPRRGQRRQGKEPGRSLPHGHKTSLTPTPTYTRTQRRPSEESELPPLPSGKKAFLWAGGQWGHVGQVMRHFSTPSQQGSRDLLGNQTLMRNSH